MPNEFQALKKAFQREIRAKVKGLRAYRRTVPPNKRKDIDLGIAVLNAICDLVALTWDTRILCPRPPMTR